MTRLYRSYNSVIAQRGKTPGALVRDFLTLQRPFGSEPPGGKTYLDKLKALNVIIIRESIIKTDRTAFEEGLPYLPDARPFGGDRALSTILHTNIDLAAAMFEHAPFETQLKAQLKFLKLLKNFGDKCVKDTEFDINDYKNGNDGTEQLDTIYDALMRTAGPWIKIAKNSFGFFSSFWGRDQRKDDALYNQYDEICSNAVRWLEGIAEEEKSTRQTQEPAMPIPVL